MRRIRAKWIPPLARFAQHLVRLHATDVFETWLATLAHVDGFGPPKLVRIARSWLSCRTARAIIGSAAIRASTRHGRFPVILRPLWFVSSRFLRRR